jgi:hypothetical protein
LNKLTPYLVITLLLWLCVGTSAQTASFDCSKATTETEIAMCADPKLSAIDIFMNIIWSEEGSTAQRDRSEQMLWISERDKCLSDTECIEQAYMKRLQEAPFKFEPMYNFYVSNFYDFGYEEVGNYLVMEGFGGAYNTTIWVYDIFENSSEPMIWKHVLWDESVITCDLNFLDGREIDFYEDFSGLGWLNFTDEGYAKKDNNFGEFSVTSKWVGHGDQSSEVIYRLVGGVFEPNRGLVDNCSDQAQKLIPVYFR